MSVLCELVKYHKQWLAFAIHKNCGDYSEDIVQEFYLRVDKYKPKQLYEASEINLNYAFFILKNIIATYHNEKNKTPEHIEINDKLVVIDESNIEIKENFETLLSKSINCINDSFDSMLFEHYLNSNDSYRDIATGSGISLTTIAKSLKKTKVKIKEQLSNEYQVIYGTR